MEPIKIKLNEDAKMDELFKLVNSENRKVAAQAREVLVGFVNPIFSLVLERSQPFEIYQKLIFEQDNEVGIPLDLYADNPIILPVTQLQRAGDIPKRFVPKTSELPIKPVTLDSACFTRKGITRYGLEKMLIRICEELRLKLTVNAWATLLYSSSHNSSYLHSGFSISENIKSFITRNELTDLFCDEESYTEIYEQLGEANRNSVSLHKFPIRHCKNLFSHFRGKDNGSSFIFGLNRLNKSQALSAVEVDNGGHITSSWVDDSFYKTGEFGIYTKIDIGFAVVNPRAFPTLILKNGPHKRIG